MSDGGKGSAPRPFSIAHEEYSKRWDAIFQRDVVEEQKEEKQDEEKSGDQSNWENTSLARLSQRFESVILHHYYAGIAQLVEHFLAKEDVESSSLFARSNNAPMAQLVAQLISNQQVGGSNPSWSTNYMRVSLRWDTSLPSCVEWSSTLPIRSMFLSTKESEGVL